MSSKFTNQKYRVVGKDLTPDEMLNDDEVYVEQIYSQKVSSFG